MTSDNVEVGSRKSDVRPDFGLQTSDFRLQTSGFAVLTAIAIVVVVCVIYWEAARSYFFNDDFQWLSDAERFHALGLLHLERYDHFYRPVIEIYFSLGRALFGCAALPFHLGSIAIHLLSVLLLALFAYDLTGRGWLAGTGALFFAVQPGFVEAVAWIGAITDLLPAFWYLLTLWLYLRFLAAGGVAYYALSIIAFTACLLTHESSATLLVMLFALEWTVSDRSRPLPARMSWARAMVRYAPFAALLAGSLTIAYIVNSRSYLIREGHYQLGWHAVLHILQYIVSLYVGKQRIWSYALVVIACGVLLVRGSPRVRFYVVWILVALAPASLFTWDNVSRYLYLPGAAFALLLAEGVIAFHDALRARIPPRVARAVVGVLTIGLALRFSIFAARGSKDFRERTKPYERLAAAVAAAYPTPPRDGVVHVDAADVYGVPEMYRQPAVEAVYCMSGVRVVVN